MRAVLLVGVGGGIGSIFRYLIQLFIGRHIPLVFPLGTLIVNISGCFLIGMFYALISKQGGFEQEWRLFLITGICGGFTTFSTFSNDGLLLLRQGSTMYFLLYVLGSVAIGFIATGLATVLFK